MEKQWKQWQTFFFLREGSKISADVDCSHEIKRSLVLQRKAMTNVAATAAKSLQSCPTLCDPMDLVYGILQARILDWVAIPFSMGSFQPRDWTQVSHIASDSLPAESQGKPKKTGVGNLSLLQGIFLPQESNQSLLHRRRILYQLSFDGSPN